MVTAMTGAPASWETVRQLGESALAGRVLERETPDPIAGGIGDDDIEKV